MKWGNLAILGVRGLVNEFTRAPNWPPVNVSLQLQVKNERKKTGVLFALPNDQLHPAEHEEGSSHEIPIPFLSLELDGKPTRITTISVPCFEPQAD